MATDLSRLARAVRMQAATIRSLLNDTHRDDDDLHLAIAGTLRSMLCDKDHPTLLELSSELVMELKVWGPYPPQAKDRESPWLTLNALVASAEPVFGGHEMTLQEYLDAPIGAAPKPNSPIENMDGCWFTPKQLIKWSANKEGASHLDPQPHQTYNSIASGFTVSGSVVMRGPNGDTPITQSNEIVIRIGLLQIAKTTLSLAELVLSRYEQNKFEQP